MSAEDADRAGGTGPRGPRRRGPRRAVGGTVAGAEPRLAGLDGSRPGVDAEAPGPGDDGAHEAWLKEQRPPHWQ